METQENGNTPDPETDCPEGKCSRYGAVPVSDVQADAINEFRKAVLSLDRVLCQLPSFGEHTFADRCIAEARTCLETCSMYGVKAISFEGHDVI